MAIDAPSCPLLTKVAPLNAAAAIAARPAAELAIAGRCRATRARTSTLTPRHLRAARMTVSAPEQRYLALRAARLRQPGAPGGWPRRMPARSRRIGLACRPGRLSLSVPGHTVGM